MNTSVVIPVFNRKNALPLCLDSVLRQLADEQEVIVVDDGSTDGTTDILKRYSNDSRVKVIFLDKNHGPAYARNRGIEHSRGAYIALIDSDCIAQPGWIENIVGPLREYPAVMIAAGKTLDAPATTYWERVNKGGDFIQRKSGFAKRAVSCNMALRRDFWARHPFNEDIPVAAAEERELCLICFKEGHKIFYNSLAEVLHSRRSTLRATWRQMFYYGYFNTHVRLRQGNFPYINYGTSLFLASIAFAAKGALFHQSIALKQSFAFGVGYFLLVAYVGVRLYGKRIDELVISYPGLFLRCLADSLGNIAYFLRWRV